VRVSGSPRVNSSTFIRQLAIKGLGIARLRQYMVTGNLTDGSLVTVLGDHPVPSRTLHVIYQRDRYQPLRMRLFIELLSARVREHFTGTPASVLPLTPPGGLSVTPAVRRESPPGTARPAESRGIL
jgi:hypothetical protein